MAECLLDEVLDRQPEDVRLLLLRTSVLERVSGPLADALTGGLGGERVLQELETANAFVASLDARRSWFRYHHLFADLLQMQPRHAAAIAQEALGDWGAADQALEHALDWAEPDGTLVFFPWHPVPGLLERHARGCARHAVLVSEILTLLTPGPGSPDPVPRGRAGHKEVRRSGEPPRDQGGRGIVPPG